MEMEMEMEMEMVMVMVMVSGRCVVYNQTGLDSLPKCGSDDAMRGDAEHERSQLKGCTFLLHPLVDT